MKCICVFSYNRRDEPMDFFLY